MGRAAELLKSLTRFEQATRPLDPLRKRFLAQRWSELPEIAKTPGQLLGRKSMGCEGTHGVFPSCDFACKPCYHSADANKVRIDGEHTVKEVTRQMEFLRAARGPGAYAQLIGGEVSLLDAKHHGEALVAMRRYGRMPMSFSHGDFDESYLRNVVVDESGRRRFKRISFAIHIDSTMVGRRDIPKPQTERELNGVRRSCMEMFERLRRDLGVRSYVAHNMTVTPSNIGEVADVIRESKQLGFRMFSFQPAAFVGNQQRWTSDFRALSDDDVWAEIERGVGRTLPTRVLQMGDLRCNRVTWGAFVGDRYVPIFEDDSPGDAKTRDMFFKVFPGGWLGSSVTVKAIKIVRGVGRHPLCVVVAGRWMFQFVRRAGGIANMRKGFRPVTFVMHSFIDEELVQPAWEMLSRGVMSDEPGLRAAQERLQACAYAMGHPESGEVVPACVQHSVLDPQENVQLVKLLPLRRKESADD